MNIIVIGFFLIIELLLLLFYIGAKSNSRREERWKEIQQKRDLSRIVKIEDGLQEWLLMLELPQLEDQKKREEVAHQLRIVLVEQLMKGPVVR